jgi:hypothetical protein
LDFLTPVLRIDANDHSALKRARLVLFFCVFSQCCSFSRRYGRNRTP